jgi:hypothetical protein
MSATTGYQLKRRYVNAHFPEHDQDHVGLHLAENARLSKMLEETTRLEVVERHRADGLKAENARLKKLLNELRQFLQGISSESIGVYSFRTRGRLIDEIQEVLK